MRGDFYNGGRRMTAVQVRAAGELLYGPHWKPRLASELGVSVRTLNYHMAAGAVPRVYGLAISYLLTQLPTGELLNRL